MTRILAVDLSNQIYKAAATNATLSSGGVYTGGLYGFIVAVQKAIRVCEATAIVVCRDSKPYKRSTLYPDYKLLRQDKKDPELVTLVKASEPLIYELAQVLNWPIFAVEGFESDDLIAHTVLTYRNRASAVVAMSNDSDLHQLFKYKVFSVYKGKHGLYKRADFDAEWGVQPQDVPAMLALTGTHNEVEGIPKVGPVTARKAVQDAALLRSYREQHASIIDRNLELIRLPHADFPKDLPVPMPGAFNERAFLRFCARYEINIHQSACEAFQQVGSK